MEKWFISKYYPTKELLHLESEKAVENFEMNCGVISVLRR